MQSMKMDYFKPSNIKQILKDGAAIGLAALAIGGCITDGQDKVKQALDVFNRDVAADGWKAVDVKEVYTTGDVPHSMVDYEKKLPDHLIIDGEYVRIEGKAKRTLLYD